MKIFTLSTGLIERISASTDGFPHLKSRMERDELKRLLDTAGKEPYSGKDYPVKRRKLTRRLKGLLRRGFSGDADAIIKALGSKRGVTPSDQLLKYSSEAFEKTIDVIINTCKSLTEIDKYAENELRSDVARAVINVKT